MFLNVFAIALRVLNVDSSQSKRYRSTKHMIDPSHVGRHYLSGKAPIRGKSLYIGSLSLSLTYPFRLTAALLSIFGDRPGDIQWFSLSLLRDVHVLRDDYVIERVREIGGYTMMDLKKAREEFDAERRLVSLRASLGAR